MPAEKTAVPAVEGWFTTDSETPALIGTRCGVCGTFSFPPERRWCPNPACDGTDLGEVTLSRRGRVWSYTNARYAPPPPNVAADPYEPFAIAAVELAEEKMVVLGQVEEGVAAADLRAGMEMELVVGTLSEDDEHRYLIWRWRPVAVGA